jgi:hypothetical protein
MLATGNSSGAEELFNKVLALDPDNDEALSGKRRLYDDDNAGFELKNRGEPKLSKHTRLKSSTCIAPLKNIETNFLKTAGPNRRLLSCFCSGPCFCARVVLLPFEDFDIL